MNLVHPREKRYTFVYNSVMEGSVLPLLLASQMTLTLSAYVRHLRRTFHATVPFRRMRMIVKSFS